MKTNLSPAERWEEIKGKAAYYSTAKMDTRYVKILRVSYDGIFTVHHPVFGEISVGVADLTDFCL
jgi:hypothetical protein